MLDFGIDLSELKFTKDLIPKTIPTKSKLDLTDIFGTFKARWGINRKNYKVEPALYSLGNPDKSSPVFVTANYKFSFDNLRKNLENIDCYILVLDTKGINVWCAAGKGTFGTKELINRIQKTELEKIVSHKNLILPQLGAVGVSAYTVKSLSGFNVKYGPVKASDIKTYINSNQRATPEMRVVKFGFIDRLKLLPIEIIGSFHYLLIFITAFALISGINNGGYSFEMILKHGWISTINLLIGYFAGCVISPLIMPWLFVKPFALKGYITGIILSTVAFFLLNLNLPLLEQISWFVIAPTISSFMMMNFTGSSTYTSLSGVMKEMKVAIPIQIGLMLIGLILFILSKFL